MGLSDVISSTIFTISAALIATALVLTLSAAILGYGNSVSDSIGVLEEEASTDMEIIHVFFESNTTGKVYVKNIGDVSFTDFNQLSVFIDADIIPSGSLTIAVTPDSGDTSIWAKGDTLEINLNLGFELDSGSHTLKTVSPNGLDTAQAKFSL